uniref:RNA helicase n=1 Tax=Crassostrea virginica TaxID=6565 RepID=A0A8B8EFP7_CRAVI|nr:probable ATP-dependent RNA helicase DDX58 isoform X2 [Crassostrea virginica]
MAEYSGMEPTSSIDHMASIKCRLDSHEIPTLVQMYRPLIVRCVKADDIVHHLEEVISTREREEIIETQNQKGSTSAMDELIETIDGSVKDKKWSIFVDIIEKQGYKYVSKALKGGEVSKDVYQKYRKMLRMNKTTHIFKLNPDDLLDLLSSEEGIIDQKDVEHIKAEQTKKGQTAATIVLLDRIWRKRENWFTSFLTVLQNKEYGYIVQEIDPTFFKETPVPITRESKPVQCSDAEEYRFLETAPKNSSKTLSDSHSENSISTDFGFKLDPNELFSKDFDSETEHDLHDSENPPNHINNEGTNQKSTLSSENTSAKSVDNHSRNMDGEETNLKMASQITTKENANNTSLGDDEVVLETFEERKYQTELARPAIQSQNCIIIAPTGSGKTIVAVKIVKHHLEVNRQGRVKKIAFVVDKSNLADQQAKVIKRFVACRLKVVSGDSMRDDFTDLSILLSQFDVFVITAQMLINAMKSKQLSITSFSLVVFDECHHCYGGHPFYKTLIPYHDLKQDEENKHILPQIVGFTASIGIGKAKCKGDVIEHIRKIMANLDADELVSVKENIEELNDKINSPDQSILKVQNRKVDEFGATIKTLMFDTEKCLKAAEDQMEDKDGVTPPNTKGNEEYTQWLQNVLREAVAKVTETNLSRSLSTVREYLEIYNEGLILYSNARALDALRFITEKIGELPRISTTEIEKQANFLFKNAKSHLENSAADGQRSEENPLLLKLKQILIDTYKEESDMRGIVFVRTRLLAKIIVNWMSETDDLKLIKARKCTGAGAQNTEGGTTKNKQKETIDLFRKGNYKVIVATTIAEEGIDVKECNLVVRYNYAGNIISQIQAKGRGRANNSRFFVLASEENCFAERETTISLKEPMMREAIETIQREILINNEAFQCEKQTLQRSAKDDRKSVASNQSTKETSQGHCVIRCMKCKEYLCPSSEIRKIGSQYACISDNLKNKVIFEKGDRTKRIGKDITIGHGKFKCNTCEKILGNVCLYKEIHFPLPNIKSILIDSEDDLKRREFLNKWKTVEELYFTPSLLTEKDLEKIAETGKLVDFN